MAVSTPGSITFDAQGPLALIDVGNVETTDGGGIAIVSGPSFIVENSLTASGGGDISVTVVSGSTLTLDAPITSSSGAINLTAPGAIDIIDTDIDTTGDITFSLSGAGGLIRFAGGANDRLVTRGSIIMDAGSGGAIDIGDLVVSGVDVGITLTGGTINTLDLIVNASGVSAQRAAARLSVQGEDAVTIGGTVSVNATSTDASGYALATASANIDAGLAGGANNNLTITGRITVAAEANAVGRRVDEASAYASANIAAGGNVAIAGAVAVTADALLEGGSAASDASASANLNIKAGLGGIGDIVITNSIAVAGTAIQRSLGNLGGTATGFAGATISGPDDVTITGAISVLGTALTSDGQSASGYGIGNLAISAGSGDLTLIGNTLVSGAATVNDGTDLAFAKGNAEINAGNNVSITGNVTVKADAEWQGTGDNGNSASADADLVVAAGGNVAVTGRLTIDADATFNGGTDSARAFADADIDAVEDITIGGGLTVTADATIGSDAFGGAFGSADASADLDAGNNVTVAGGINIGATVHNNAFEGSDAFGSADLTMEADSGSINIFGATLVTATGLVTEAGTDTESAFVAEATLNAADDIIVVGSITVAARDERTAARGTGNDIDATATANLFLHAGTDGSGDLIVTGNTLVTATASVTGGTANAEGLAMADLIAANDVMITGRVSFIADVDGAPKPGEGGSASAVMTISAGTAAGVGDIVVGGITVSADHTYALGTDGAAADAVARVFAPGDITINGSVAVSADAVAGTQASRASADAFASADFDAGGNIAVNGSVQVAALALVDEGLLFGSGAAAFAGLFMDAGTGGVGGELRTGSIRVTAGAIQTAENVFTGDATATAALAAFGDVTLGAITIGAAARADDAQIIALQHNADANLDIDAGTGGSGDIVVSGQVLVVADAATLGGSLSGATASATANLQAPGNVTVTGRVSAIADAIVDGSATFGFNGAEAFAHVVLDAGTRGGSGAAELKVGGFVSSAEASVGSRLVLGEVRIRWSARPTSRHGPTAI